MSEAPAAAEVASRIGGSAFWETASSIGSQVIRFALFVILARLVSPAEFGVVAIASVLIDFVSVLAIGGISDAIVRKPQLSDVDADTAFWTNLGAGVVFLGVGALVSPLVADVFRTPALGPVLTALSFSFVIWPLGATHTSRMSRELNFKALAIRTLAANLIGAGVGIAMALRGNGVWALVARALVTTATLVLMSWLAHPWRPKFRYRVHALGELSGFGSKIMGAQLVSQLNSRGLELIAGLLIAPAAVGLLRVGGQCFSLLTQIGVAPVAAIAFPLLSRTQGDPIAGREVFAKVCRLSALMIYPVFFGAMAVSDLVFPLMFGKDWALTGAVMPMLCALAIPLQMNLLMQAGLASRGKAGAALRWSLLQAGVGLPLSAVGGLFGLFPLLGFTIARSYLLLPVGLRWLARNTEMSPKVLVLQSLRPFASALAMAGTVLAAKALIGEAVPTVPKIALLVAIGGVAYVGLMLAGDRELRSAAGARLRTRMS